MVCYVSFIGLKLILKKLIGLGNWIFSFSLGFIIKEN